MFCLNYKGFIRILLTSLVKNLTGLTFGTNLFMNINTSLNFNIAPKFKTSCVIGPQVFNIELYMRIVRSIQLFAADTDKLRSCKCNDKSASSYNPFYIIPKRIYILIFNKVQCSIKISGPADSGDRYSTVIDEKYVYQ